MELNEPRRQPTGPESWLGVAVPRREDARFLTGTAVYAADVRPEGLLHAAFVRSPIASATGLTADVGPARDAPGVVAVFTADDLHLPDIPGHGGPARPEAPAMTRPPLARGTVRYLGEPVAVVVADDPYAAVDAAELAELDFTEATVVATAAAAVEDEVLLFPAAGSNVVARTAVPEGLTPDLDRWPVRAAVEIQQQRLAPVPIEPVSIVAAPDGDRRLTVWCGHQAPHRLRRQLAGLLRIDQGSIRVIVPDVGGAFGMKSMLYPEYPVVAAAALRLGRPVAWQQTRYEQFISGTHGRGMRHRVELAGEPDGRIRAGRVEILADLGAYPHNGSGVPLFAQLLAQGAYDIADFAVSTTMVVTNRAQTGPYRGAGRPDANFAMERAVDAFGRRVGLDPAEVRRRNLVRPAQMPYRTATGALYDGGDYPAALARALELADEQAVRAEQARRLATGEDPIGLGIGMFVERAGGDAASTEYARVEVDAQGRVCARVGSSATGQGHETVYSQIVASALGVRPDEVTVIEGDTDAVATGTGSFASRSAQVGGSAVHLAAQRVRDCACELASRLLEVPPPELAPAPGGGYRAGGRVASLAEIAAFARREGVELVAEETWSPGAQTFPYGACVAVIEVERDTGRVLLRRMVAVDDCGRLLNPLIVEGQLQGSLLQGVAQALYEGIEYDESAQLLNASLADYAVPTAPDAPAYTTAHLETPAPSNPLGVKGAGESGCIGAPPAVVNAVLDALAPYGVTDLQMPLTPQQVWRRLHEAAR